jgi:branched-subunit amino acid ABC-type transport system permease component
VFGQFAANGVAAGAVYALVALGFGLIYRSAKFFHFAHAASYTVAAYLAYALGAGRGQVIPVFFYPSSGLDSLASRRIG